MLKVEIDREQFKALEAHGSMSDLVVELGMIIGQLHTEFAERHSEAAEAFRAGVQHIVRDEAPTWEPSKLPGVSFAVIREKK